MCWPGGVLMKKNGTMKCLPVLDRPYERVERFGAKTLTDSELLAVIIKTGTKGKTAIDVSRALFERFEGGLTEICDAGIRELMSVAGIGRVKAVQLKALGELAARMSGDRKQVPINAGDVSSLGGLLVSEMGRMRKEVFRILLLDKKLRVMRQHDVSVGILDKTLVHPREVFSYAIRECCYTVIIAHNHPSGDVTPSRDDIEITARLAEAGEIIGIRIYDHIIAGRDGFYSMREKGDLKKIIRIA